MPRTIEGNLADPGGRFAIVAGRFNEFITSRLIDGCDNALRRHGIDTEDRLDVVWVPGAYEIPMICDKLAGSGSYRAVIALGAVIRGHTSHYDLVAGEAAKVGAISVKHGLPVIFGVLTTETIEQAIERAGSKAGNSGYKAGVAAIEMANLVQKLGD